MKEPSAHCDFHNVKEDQMINFNVRTSSSGIKTYKRSFFSKIEANKRILLILSSHPLNQLNRIFS